MRYAASTVPNTARQSDHCGTQHKHHLCRVLVWIHAATSACGVARCRAWTTSRGHNTSWRRQQQQLQGRAACCGALLGWGPMRAWLVSLAHCCVALPECCRSPSGAPTAVRREPVVCYIHTPTAAVTTSCYRPVRPTWVCPLHFKQLCNRCLVCWEAAVGPLLRPNGSV